MFENLFFQRLFRATLIALIGLLLYGVFPETLLVAILLYFVGLRLSFLATEAIDLKRHATLPARKLAETQVDNAGRINPPPRPMGELIAETLGVFAFALLIPLDIALYSRDFFSLNTPQGWEGAVIVVLCIGLYAWPHFWLKAPDFSLSRSLWWAIPFALALPLLDVAVETRHPYLNPLNPNHAQLAAERVLALKNNIVAGRNAGWVFNYANQLDARGQSQQAIHYYREGLRLDPDSRKARARLDTLEAHESNTAGGSWDPAAIDPSAPFWTVDKPVTRSPRRHIDSQFERAKGCTVVIVPVGEVSDELLDAVGFAIHNELDLPVYISPNPVPLPPHTRIRGLVTSRQWNQHSLAQAFFDAAAPLPRAPIKYVLITSVDIYMDETNYVFSASYDWGGVVSSARLEAIKNNRSPARLRIAKQAICALIKSFNVPTSTDRNCVTSYVHDIEEFDMKGNRPNAETLKLFQKAVADLNNDWQQHKTMP